MNHPRPKARQPVSHGHFTVDGRKVDIPSYRLKPGQVVRLCDEHLVVEFSSRYLLDT